MSKLRIDWPVIRDPSWLHWAATIPLLVGHLAGVRGCLGAAFVLCVVMAVTMWLRTRSLLAMPVQVRLVYAGLLVAGIAPGLFWLWDVQLVGTTAMVLFGYCPLVRILTLFPWNRTAPIDKAWLGRLFLSATPGGLVNLSEPSTRAVACSCSCSLPERTPQQTLTPRPM